MSGRTSINITSHTVYTNADLSDDQFNIFTDGSLVFGNDLLTDDAITMIGQARIRAPVTIDDSLTLDDTVTLVNASVVTQNGDALVLGESSSDAATVRNIAGATWDLTNGADIATAGSSQFINLGLLEQSGGSGSTIGSNFIDRGGTIEIDDSLQFGSARFVDDTIEGPGSLDLFGDDVLDGTTVSTADDRWANVRIVGDVTLESNYAVISALNLAAGAVFTFSGGISIGEIFGPGEIDIKGEANVFTDFAAELVGGVRFDNFGNTTFDGMLSEFTGGFEITATAWTGDQITIENHAGATWTVQEDFADFISHSGSSVIFYNNGMFFDLTNGGASFEMDVVNNGQMESNFYYPGLDRPNSGISFDDAVTGMGTIEISRHRVTADALVGSGQTFEFNSTISGPIDSTLSLNDVQQFSGLITGFDQNGDTDDQLVVNTATWHYQDFVANGGGTGGSLMFTNGSVETAVNLTGSYNPAGFTAVVSGNQTTITYTG